MAPGQLEAAALKALGPDGVLLSNGPGDPAQVDAGRRAQGPALTEQPSWGICLGHQILARVAGAKTFKLPFGHRGPNQPVQRLESGAIDMTSQNHGYAVEASSLPEELEVTHINLNDQTVAGFRHRSAPMAAVQYHPEAGPGPNDAQRFFDEFVEVVRARA